MQYALVISESPESYADRINENQEAYWGAWSAYAKTIAESGVMRGGAGLQMPDTATVVTFKGDTKTVHDGPYAETKEQLGGFFIIEVNNLDEALAWAKKCPIMRGGHVEIRPVLPPPPQ